jgi:hypothetical protein
MCPHTSIMCNSLLLLFTTTVSLLLLTVYTCPLLLYMCPHTSIMCNSLLLLSLYYCQAISRPKTRGSVWATVFSLLSALSPGASSSQVFFFGFSFFHCLPRIFFWLFFCRFFVKQYDDTYIHTRAKDPVADML